MILHLRLVMIAIQLIILSASSETEKLIRRDQWGVEACGKPRNDVGLIVNGIEVMHGQFPWIVALNQTKIGLSYFCGGTLVSLKHVITGMEVDSNEH